MLFLYDCFRNFHIEWMLNTGFLAYALYRLCAEEDCRIGMLPYVLLNVLSLAVTIPLVRYIPYISMFPTQTTAIWCFFLFMMLVVLAWAAAALRRHFFECVGYGCFYAVFILLYKMVCSVLYGAESRMPKGRYAFLDIASILLLYVLLSLLTFLFRRVRLRIEIPFLKRTYLMALFFPVSFFAYFILYASGNPVISLYQLPVIGAVLLANLPIIYYVFAKIIEAYHDKITMNQALAETRAQLARYRYSIELEERLRKEKHELKNNYLYIQMLLERGDHAELEKYLNDVIGERLEQLNVVQTGNAMIDYLLNRKLAEARKYRIRVCTEIVVPEKLPVSDDVLCTILLNLLDNAITASRQEENGYIHIVIKCVKNYLLCEVSNKVSGNVLETNPGLRTTKADRRNHGLGLKIVRKAAEDNNGLFEVSVANGCFNAKVMLGFGVDFSG